MPRSAPSLLPDELTPKYGVPIVQFTYWYAASEPIAGILETQKGLQHACEAETSMMMALRPELVAESRIPLAKSNTTPEVVSLVGAGVYRWRAVGSVSSAGVRGNPEAASPEKGERLLRGISETLAAKLMNKEFWDLPWHSDPVEA